ncbi:MAG TPA: hypothetical protein VKU00_06835 [Chthonomonadaceae bacterium]|nr:hypothetical protein [Chthonomonadaceae bacterium]
MRTSPSSHTCIGEVLAANTTRFIAQCPAERLHDPPALGAFVRVLPPGSSAPSASPAPVEVLDDPFADPVPTSPAALTAVPEETLYALVFSATTGSLEPGRRAAAYGLDETQLREEQPQIFDLLATEFAALHIGFVRDGRLRLYLPARPPRLHAMVEVCSPAETCALTEAPDLLRTLLAVTGDVSADELIAACLRQAYEHRNRDFAYLVRMGKQLAILLRDDPERLAALLRKLEP